MHPLGECCTYPRAPAGRVEAAGVGHEIVAQLGGWPARQLDAEHRHELTIDVLMEPAEHQRRASREIALDLDVDMSRALGTERAASVERREGSLGRQPDPVVAGRQELLGPRCD